MTPLRQSHGDSGGNRRLSDAALAHDHDEAALALRDVIDQPVEARQVNRLGALLAGCNWRRIGGRQERPESRKADDVETKQRDFVSRQFRERRRHRGQSLVLIPLKRNCNDIGWVRGVEASIHSEELVREIERIEFARCSGCLADRASVGAGDQR